MLEVIVSYTSRVDEPPPHFVALYELGEHNLTAYEASLGTRGAYVGQCSFVVPSDDNRQVVAKLIRDGREGTTEVAATQPIFLRRRLARGSVNMKRVTTGTTPTRDAASYVVETPAQSIRARRQIKSLYVTPS